MRMMLFLIVVFAVVMYGDDITIPLDHGAIVIRNAHFIRVEDGSYIPKLSFNIE